MPFANVERVPGGYVVSRLFTNQAAAQRGVDLLMGVNEAAFDPAPRPEQQAQHWSDYRAGHESARVSAYDAHPFDPVAAEEGDTVLLIGADGTARRFRVGELIEIAEPVNYEIKQFVTGSFGETLKGVVPGSVRLDGQPLNLPSDADGS